MCNTYRASDHSIYSLVSGEFVNFIPGINTTSTKSTVVMPYNINMTLTFTSPHDLDFSDYTRLGADDIHYWFINYLLLQSSHSCYKVTSDFNYRYNKSIQQLILYHSLQQLILYHEKVYYFPLRILAVSFLSFWLSVWFCLLQKKCNLYYYYIYALLYRTVLFLRAYSSFHRLSITIYTHSVIQY
mgnify:CR=1 FL=1